MTTLLGFIAFSARADDLVTRNGDVYHDYQVLSYDAGFVTIMDRDGGARIPLAELPAPLQREYHYDAAAATATVQQFNAQDRQEKTAVEQAENSPAAAGTPDAPAAPSPEEPAPAIPAATQAPSTAATFPTTASATPASSGSAASTFDPGFDPMAPNASILSSRPAEGDDSESQQQSSYYDSSGILWLGSTNADGTVRWSRAVHEGTAEQIRLGQSDLPPGAVALRDAAGRWMVTYVDQTGRVEHVYRPEFGNSIHEGEWKVVMNTDGTRSLQRQDRPSQVTYHAPEYFAAATSSSGGNHGTSTSSHPQTTSFRVVTVARVATSSPTTTLPPVPPRH